MEAAFADCERLGQPASVLFLEVTRLDRQSLELGLRPADVRGAVIELLCRDARGGDLYACEEGAGILVLLTNTDPESTGLICGRAIEAAKKLTLAGAPRPVRVGRGLGLAPSPGPGALLVDTRVRVAGEGGAGAKQRGGECFVHTMLYEVMQRRAEKLALASGKSPRRPAVEAEDSPADEPLQQAPPAPRVSSPTQEEATPAQPAQEEVEILRRRVAKLKRALEARERTLAELTAMKGVVPGIASTYREVQGLSVADPDRERKETLLQRIFAANLELVHMRRMGASSLQQAAADPGPAAREVAPALP
jgi:hypothetical protein